MANRSVTSRFLTLLLALLCVKTAVGAELTVEVLDEGGAPVANVAVFVKQPGGDSGAPAAAVMDQREVRFVPHILIVEQGAAVEFPNSDTVAHHVYSFSRPNNFVLPLYKGKLPDPILMQHPGVVTLGCNIHDGMLGYILVVDTGVFGKTNASGKLVLTVDDAATSLDVSIWSPRIRDSKDPLVQTLDAIPEAGVTFHLQKSLRPSHADESDALEWEEY